MKQALLTFLGLAAMWPATQVSAQITAADISWKDYGMAYEEETDAVLISEWRAFHYLASYFDGKNFSNYDTVQTELSVAISSLALSNDIDLSGRDLSFDLNIPFDGRGHKISNPGGAIFGTIGAAGEVYHLEVVSDVESFYSPGYATSYDDAYVGGIAKINQGTIRECAFANYIKVDVQQYLYSNIYREVSDFGGDNKYIGLAFGGVVGKNEGTIENCLVANQIVADNSGDTAQLTNNLLISNIAGVNDGTIANTFLTHWKKYKASYVTEATDVETYNLLDIGVLSFYCYSLEDTTSIPASCGIGYVTADMGKGTIKNVVVDDNGNGAPDLSIRKTTDRGNFTMEWSETEQGKTFTKLMSEQLTSADWATDIRWPNDALSVLDEPELWTFTSNVYDTQDSDGNTIFRRAIPTMGNAELESSRAWVMNTGYNIDLDKGILYITSKAGWEAAFGYGDNQHDNNGRLIQAVPAGTDSVTYICTKISQDCDECDVVYDGCELRGIVLECDIDFLTEDGYSSYVSIDKNASKFLKDFTFDGRGHYLRGLSPYDYTSIFMYYLPEGCTVKNLAMIFDEGNFEMGNDNLERFAFDPKDETMAAASPFIGVNSGTIQNCIIECSGYYINGMNTNTSIGTVAGINRGTIRSVRSSVGLVLPQNCNFGYVTGSPKFYLGGIVGMNYGTLEDILLSEAKLSVGGDATCSTPIGIGDSLACSSATIDDNTELLAGMISGWNSLDSKISKVVITKGMNEPSISSEDGVSFTIYDKDKVTKGWSINKTPTEVEPDNENPQSEGMIWWKDENLSIFNDPTKWTFMCAESECNNAASDWGYGTRRPIPTLRNNALNYSETSQGTKQIEACDSTSFFDLMTLLSDPNNTFFDEANCAITQNISFAAQEVDMDTLTINGATLAYANMPSVDTLKAVVDGGGSTISNMVYTTTGSMFNEVAEDASFGNMLFENATMVVDPSNEAYDYNDDLGCTVVNLFADNVLGSINNLGFAGSIIFDETTAPTSGDLAVSFVNNLANGAELSGFLYLEDVLTGNNSTETDTKRCLTIKQNMGAASKGSTAKAKVALSKSSDTKSLETNAFSNLKSVNLNKYNYSQEELEKNEREFTAEEFASGAVAYWLNWSDKGYTGVYTGKWAQGPKYPIPASNTEGSAAGTIQMVTYEVDNATLLTAAPAFCNTGSNLVIEYAEQPKFIKYGNDYVTLGATSATISFTDPSKKVVISFNTKALNNVASDANIRIATNGKTISILGAEGQMAQLVNLSGAVVAQSNSGKLTAPAGGVYLLKVGNMSWRVGVK